MQSDGMIELTFRGTGQLKHPFANGRLTVDFASNEASRHVRTGFYKGGGIWMVRFRPPSPGPWTYTARFQHDDLRQTFTGRFNAARAGGPAPLHRDAANSNQWVTATGEPFFPLGIQDCVGADERNDLSFVVDGEGRDDGKGRALRAGEYFSLFGQAGFNLLRFSQRNCSPALFDTLDSYREREMELTDHLLRTARNQGFRIMFGIFGYHGHWYSGKLPGKIWHALLVRAGAADEGVDDPSKASVIAKEKRFIEYAVARWGEDVDFWELLNERRAHRDWTRIMASYLRSVDPGRKPITTSWDQPDVQELDFVAPHWYASEPLRESDLHVIREAALWKKYRKPVLMGEHGNAGMNWDPASADRLRVRLWTGLFQEVGFVLWHTGWSKFGMYGGRYTPGAAANIYLGPQERSYTRAFGEFRSRLRGGLRTVPVRVSAPDAIRAYGLASASQTAVYLWHFGDPAASSAVDVTVALPEGVRTASWIDPATGRVLATFRPKPGNSINAPPFVADLALLASAEEAP